MAHYMQRRDRQIITWRFRHHKAAAYENFSEALWAPNIKS